MNIIIFEWVIGNWKYVLCTQICGGRVCYGLMLTDSSGLNQDYLQWMMSDARTRINNVKRSGSNNKEAVGATGNNQGTKSTKNG